jgi:hypothetical protein
MHNITDVRRPITARYFEDEVVEAFEFLDRLRRVGCVNMLAAYPLLADEMLLSREEARALWGVWAETFNDAMSAQARVRAMYHEAGL